MDIVYVSWSGGKDSTAAVLLHIARGDYVKAVCYVPMFTPEIPLITKEHYNHLIKTAHYFRTHGAEVYFIHGIDYYSNCTREARSGKYKGKILGYPPPIVGKCSFNRDSKLKSLKNADVGIYDYMDVGIALDEPLRHHNINGTTRRSILIERNITEAMARQICINNGVLSPIYNTGTRDGCALCPNAKRGVLERWLRDYPEALPILLELDAYLHEKRPERPPLRGRKWFTEVIKCLPEQPIK